MDITFFNQKNLQSSKSSLLTNGESNKNHSFSRNIPLGIKIKHPEGLSQQSKISIMEFSKDIVKKYFDHSIGTLAGMKIDRENSTIYIIFPEIVVSSNNCLLRKIVSEIYVFCSKTINGAADCNFELILDIDSVFYQEEDSNRRSIIFDIEATKRDGSTISDFSESDLIEMASRDPSENFLSLSVDRFDFIIDNFKNINNSIEVFKKNILIFASAYVKYYTEKNYNERNGVIFNRESWIDFSRQFGASLVDASDAYSEQHNFAYTILTLEEILRCESSEMNLKIEKYNRELFIKNVKTLLTSNLPITDNCLWKLFSEYIRRDHFYFDRSIYVFNGVVSKPVEASSLRGIADRFISEIESVKDSFNLVDNEETQDKTKINAKQAHRFGEIMSAFSNRRSLLIINDSCSHYLKTEIKKGTSRNSVCFKDCCVVYKVIDGKKTLEMRKPFMEDHFLFSTEYEILNFGKTEAEKQAMRDIDISFKKMFVYDENIKFFKCWLGSIYRQNPERCGLFLYGKKKNAKSAVINAFIEALGKYGKSIRPDMFYHSNKGGVTCDPFWADAADMLIGASPESNGKTPISSVVFKAKTGGDIENTAAKGKDPFEYRNKAKFVWTANGWVQFDNIDAATISRLFPLRCYGIFEEETCNVPLTEEEQNEKGIYHADANYYNTIRKKALLYLSVTTFFEMYAEHGLKRTSLMEKELSEWISKTSDYAKFYIQLEEAKEGEEYKVPATELKRIFTLKFGKVSQDITLETFMEELENVTSLSPYEIDGIYYYNMKHREITNFTVIHKVERERLFNFTELNH